MRNVYLDYVHHDFGYYFSPEFMEKHINLKASPNLHSAYELGKSLSRISLGQLEARNASGHLSETNVNSVILDGHDRQVHKLMWEVERRQPEYREHFIYTTQQPYRVSTTKDKGGRQSKDVAICFKYAVRHAVELGRHVIDHYQP